MEEINIYSVVLKSNCYKYGYDVKIASKNLEETISKAKKHLEEDIDNINIEVMSVSRLMENVII